MLTFVLDLQSVCLIMRSNDCINLYSLTCTEAPSTVTRGHLAGAVIAGKMEASFCIVHPLIPRSHILPEPIHPAMVSSQSFCSWQCKAFKGHCVYLFIVLVVSHSHWIYVWITAAWAPGLLQQANIYSFNIFKHVSMFVQVFLIERERMRNSYFSNAWKHTHIYTLQHWLLGFFWEVLEFTLDQTFGNSGSCSINIDDRVSTS